jgi:hypothetical protein
VVNCTGKLDSQRARHPLNLTADREPDQSPTPATRKNTKNGSDPAQPTLLELSEETAREAQSDGVVDLATYSPILPLQLSSRLYRPGWRNDWEIRDTVFADLASGNQTAAFARSWSLGESQVARTASASRTLSEALATDKDWTVSDSVLEEAFE